MKVNGSEVYANKNERSINSMQRKLYSKMIFSRQLEVLSAKIK